MILSRNMLINFVLMSIDIDECCIGISCHEQSTCANSFGNFTCTCNNGYSGNGTFCEGIIIIM